MKPAIKATLAYLAVGFSWIFFSDRALLLLVASSDIPYSGGLQTAKGLSYVAVTGILLYFLVRRYIRQIEQKVKELEVLNEKLEEQAVQLKQSNQDLEQFAYTASHDLQEPLRMISSFMAQLDKKYHDQLDEKAHQYIYFAIDGAKRMRKILIDLLEYSRIGRLTAGPSLVNTEEVIKECVEELAPLIKQKQAAVSVGGDFPTLWLDDKLAKLIVFHLVDNALKFCEQDTQPVVDIRGEDIGENWSLSVKDNGIGIEASYFEKIFVIFQKLHAASQYEGSGIGLASVKKAVEIRGGSVQLTSILGKGSVFTVILPKKKD
jgi:light-regulated signal transduction histidine kinase (bacteriophytochrome)